MEASEIEAHISQIMRERQYVKKRRTWYRGTDQCVVLLNLQLSGFGNAVYLNLGVWLRSMGALEFPPEPRCHIRLRATTLLPVEEQRWYEREVLDLACETVSKDERAHALERLIRDYVLPLLEDASNLEGLRRMFAEGRLGNALIVKDVRDELRSNLPTSIPAPGGPEGGRPGEG